MKTRLVNAILASTAGLLLPVFAFASDDHHIQSATTTQVDFGVLPTGPLGPPPCLQTGAIGGPADPCAYKLHHLTPEETTVPQGGEVTFQFHGGGHGIIVYQVDEKTTRTSVGQFLCAGKDPETITDPGQHVCDLSVANANAAHTVMDAKGNTVIVVDANPTNANTFPLNRVWYVPGRYMSAGGRQFMNGGTIPAGATSDGQLLTFRFLDKGRYLVMCMNRTHSMNDWMFGFVNVVEDSNGNGK